MNDFSLPLRPPALNPPKPVELPVMPPAAGSYLGPEPTPPPIVDVVSESGILRLDPLDENSLMSEIDLD
jgi:hypothetical protein